MNHLVQLLKVTARTLVGRAACILSLTFCFYVAVYAALESFICCGVRSGDGLMLQTQKEGHGTLLQYFRRKCLDRFSRPDISGEESHELSTGYFTQIY